MLEPLLHRLIVKPKEFKEFNKDHKKMAELGLIVPELEELKRAAASVDEGVVVSIGPTAYRDYNVTCPIKVGDIVNYARFSGKHVEDHTTGETFVVLNDEDVICVVKE
jgi:co-chaperonin GroES (HSP10)